jgi:hypothetical protein
MTRPPAKTLLTLDYTEETGLDILAAESLYAVLYLDQPINVKQRYFCIRGPLNKYSKTVYPSLKPAQNLCNKLNTEFNTTDFSVKKVL